MKTSDAGKLEICEHEGIVPGPYLDSVGVWTYGIGHTSAAGKPVPSTMPRGMPADIDGEIDKALKVFAADLEIYEARVNEHVTVPLEQHEFDALVSFDFNTGGIWYRTKSGPMANATAIKLLNKGDRNGAANALLNWLRPPAVTKRRQAERALFLTGDYSANGDEIPIWRVNATGSLKGVLKVVHGEDVLRRMQRPAEPPVDPVVAWWASAPPGAVEWLRRAPV